MQRKLQKSASDTGSKGKHARVWVDPDDAPEITDEMLDRAEVVKDGKIIQRGRPPLGDQPKTSVTLRLDAEIVAAYRGTGAGWQSRINADLRKSAKRLKA